MPTKQFSLEEKGQTRVSTGKRPSPFTVSRKGALACVSQTALKVSSRPKRAHHQVLEERVCRAGEQGRCRASAALGLSLVT